MSDENKVVEEFLGDLRDNAEKDPLTQENEDPFASLNEEVQPVTEEIVEKEEKLPFNKDPKVQRFIDKQVEKALANRPEPKVEPETQDNYFDDVVAAFTEIVGNDTPQKVKALDSLKNSLTTLEQRTLERAIQRQDLQQQEEARVEQEYENKISDGFEAIEEETGTDLLAPQNKKLRVKFLEFVEQVAPKENGEISELPDLGETFKAFQSINRQTSQTPRAKDLASKSMERSNGDITQPKETGRVTWDNVMEKMGF